jgi:phage gp36-like protein
MAYSTLAQVQTAVGGPDRLRELSDLSNVNLLDATVVAAAIAEADAEIDSYIGHRFAVPLSVAPPIVALKSAAWAARILRRNRYNGQPLQDDLDREATDREWLRGVADGTISLGIEPSPAGASMVIDRAGLRDPTLDVSRQRTKGFW